IAGLYLGLPCLGALPFDEGQMKWERERMLEALQTAHAGERHAPRHRGVQLEPPAGAREGPLQNDGVDRNLLTTLPFDGANREGGLDTAPLLDHFFEVDAHKCGPNYSKWPRGVNPRDSALRKECRAPTFKGPATGRQPGLGNHRELFPSPGVLRLHRQRLLELATGAHGEP